MKQSEVLLKQFDVIHQCPDKLWSEFHTLSELMVLYGHLYKKLLFNSDSEILTKIILKQISQLDFTE